MGDVYNVYEPWSRAAWAGEGVVGINSVWVYPQLALAPMLAAWAFAWIVNYTVGWGVMIAVLNAAGFAVLLRNGRSRARRCAAGVWLVLIVALGPIGLYRIDAVTVPLVIVAFLMLSRRPFLAGLILGAGAWIKIWPAVGVSTIFAVRAHMLRVASGVATATAVVVGTVVALGGGTHLFGFLSSQFGRGLQMESVAATPFVIFATLGVPGYKVAFDPNIITFQVSGPGVSETAAVLTPLLGASVIAVTIWFLLRARSAPSRVRLAFPLLLTSVLLLIVLNKVGSPQFMSWLIAPLVMWCVLDSRRASPVLPPAVVLLVMTQLVYPVAFDLVRVAHPVGTLILVARNVTLLYLFFVIARVLWQSVAHRPQLAHIA